MGAAGEVDYCFVAHSGWGLGVSLCSSLGALNEDNLPESLLRFMTLHQSRILRELENCWYLLEAKSDSGSGFALRSRMRLVVKGEIDVCL